MSNPAMWIAMVVGVAVGVVVVGDGGVVIASAGAEEEAPAEEVLLVVVCPDIVLVSDTRLSGQAMRRK